MASNVFHVIKAANLDAERDVFVGLPQDGNNKQAFHRVPVRSSNLETADGRLSRVQLLSGQTHVVQNTHAGRRHLRIQMDPILLSVCKVCDDF